MGKKIPLLISSCLCGECCRYDGAHNLIAELQNLEQLYHLIPVCPEVLGGLTTPRDAAERVGNRVITYKGHDVTEQFFSGALQAVAIAQQYDCKLALLKAKSPSCGFGMIYDGTFEGALIKGNGVTSELLLKHDVKIYTELTVSKLLEYNSVQK